MLYNIHRLPFVVWQNVWFLLIQSTRCTRTHVHSAVHIRCLHGSVHSTYHHLTPHRSHLNYYAGVYNVIGCNSPAHFQWIIKTYARTSSFFLTLFFSFLYFFVCFHFGAQRRMHSLPHISNVWCGSAAVVGGSRQMLLAWERNAIGPPQWQRPT